MTRKYTNKLLEDLDDGVLVSRDIIIMCLSYMSEDDVKDMCLSNDLYVDGFETEEDYEY